VQDLETLRIFGIEDGHLLLDGFLGRPDPVCEDAEVGLELAEEVGRHALHHRLVVRLVDENCKT